MRLLSASIIICVCLFHALISFTQELEVNSNYINDENGILGHRIYSIEKDSRGFMWFGTDMGLCKFDGYKLSKFNFPTRSFTKSKRIVYSVYDDGAHGLWIGSNKELLRVNHKTGDIENHIPKVEEHIKFRRNHVVSIKHDTNNHLYIAFKHGILRYLKDSKTFVKLEEEVVDSLNETNTFHIDRLNRVWIGNKSGLHCYIISNKKKLVLNNKINTTGLKDVNIRTIAEDDNNNIWVGGTAKELYCWKKDCKEPQLFYNINKRINWLSFYDSTTMILATNRGLKFYDTAKRKFIPFNAKNPQSNTSVNMICGYLDSEKNIWLGTHKHKILQIHFIDYPFKIVKERSYNGTTIQFGFVNGFYEKADNQLWVYDDSKVTILDEHNEVRKYSASFHISNLIDFEPGYLLVGDLKKGLLLNKLHASIDDIQGNIIFSKRKKLNGEIKVKGFIKDHDGKIWIITFKSGLIIYDPDSNKFFDSKNNGNFPNEIFKYKNLDYINIDNKGSIWIYTLGANKLYRYSKETGYKLIKYKGESLTIINAIYEDKQSRIIAATNVGLYLLNPEKDFLEPIRIKGFKSSKPIYSIMEDDFGYLWVTSTSGLFKLSPQTFGIEYSASQNGLHITDFAANSTIKTKNGNIYFGRSNGFISFNPEEIRAKFKYPTIVFTRFRLLESSPGAGKILEGPINETKAIDLKHSENSFNIEFGILDYYKNNDYEFIYKLRGHDKIWIHSGSNRNAIYSNLPSGNYDFVIRLLDKLDYPSPQIRKINISVAPPIWQLWWFKLFIVITITSITTLFFIFRTVNYKKREKELEEKIRKRTEELLVSNDKLQSTNISLQQQKDIALKQRDQLRQMVRQINELSKSRVRFFTNISHELLTPLTLIIGPAEKLITSSVEKITLESLKNNYALIFSNAKRLLNLVNQLLDYQKVETGVLKLKLLNGDIVKFIEKLVLTMQGTANQKNTSLSFSSSIDKHIMPFDHDKIEKILYNLLDNAIKFTGKGDGIKVTLDIKPNNEDNKKGKYLITVEDTGVGISEEKLELIFKRFYSLENKGKNIQSFGIGLAYVKDLVDFIRGEIKVSSKVGEGTRFDILLPYNMNLIAKSNDEYESSIIPEIKNSMVSGSTENNSFIKDKTYRIEENNRENILIAEDNRGIREFIVECLNNEFNTLEAKDGNEAIEILKSNEIDIIISDILMPNKDGIQLCKEVRNDITFSHIPIILLTARTLVEHELEGLQSGADDYITKPFNKEILLARITNLLNLRKQIKEKYKHEFLSKIDVPIPNSIDDKFLLKLNEFLEDNYSNSDLSIEIISSELALSRQHLFRKIKTIVGLTPAEYLTSFRLKKAAAILSQGSQNITYTSEMCGFKSLSTFTRSFTKQFGISPKEYSQNS